MNKFSTFLTGACLILATHSVAQQTLTPISKEALLEAAPTLQQDFRQFYGFKKITNN